MRVLRITVLIWFLCHTMLSDLGVASAEEATKEVLGVLDLEAREGFSVSEAAIISERLQEHIIRTGIFEVVERAEIQRIMEEQRFSLSGACDTEEECAVRVGQMIQAQRMIAGSVGKVGKLFTVSIRMFDVETGKILKSSSRDSEGPIERILTATTEELAWEIVGLEWTPKRSRTWLWIMLGAIVLGGGAVAVLAPRPSPGGDEIPPPPPHP